MENVMIEQKLKFESSLMHQIATEFEVRSGYEVAVIGEAVIDTIYDLEPESVALYLLIPNQEDAENNNSIVEELTKKDVFTFKENKTYDGHTVSVGILHMLDKEITIFIGQEPVEEFVQHAFEMDILLATYTVRDGLSIPSQEVEKAINSKTISYYCKKVVNDESTGHFTYKQPTDTQMIRILKATNRYQCGLNPVYARPSNVFKDHPFGELKFMDTRRAENGKETVISELGNLLALEVPEYKKTILNILNDLLIDNGYQFSELKKMRVTLHGYNQGFEVTLIYDNHPVLKSENDTLIAEPIEKVREAL